MKQEPGVGASCINQPFHYRPGTPGIREHQAPLNTWQSRGTERVWGDPPTFQHDQTMKQKYY